MSEERDRIHEAHEHEERLARQQAARAAAQAELQRAREEAALTGGPTPEELELQRQENHKKFLAGNGDGLEEAQQHTSGLPVVQGGQLANELAGALSDLSDYEDDMIHGGWGPSGSANISWAVGATDDGVEIGFRVQVDDEEPAVVVFDVDQRKLDSWVKGLQNADSHERLAAALVERIYATTAQGAARHLADALQEAKDGKHLEQDPPTETSVDNDEPVLTDEERQAIIDAITGAE